VTIGPSLVAIGPRWMAIDPGVVLRWETGLGIAGPTGVFGESRDCRAVIGEPFAGDLAHVSDE